MGTDFDKIPNVKWAPSQAMERGDGVLDLPLQHAFLPSPGLLPHKTASVGANMGASGMFTPTITDDYFGLRSAPSDPQTPEQAAQLPSPPYSQVASTERASPDDRFDEHFVFHVDLPAGPFTFETADSVPRGSKRHRAVHDVDGPSTARLSCKKRRLRHELITSRLSQPFSLPATHIINREAIAAGDKRFMKLAASVNASKRCPSVQDSLVRRAALLNSTRSRVQEQLHGSEGVLVAAQPRVQQRGYQNSTSGRFWVLTTPSMPCKSSSGRSRPGEACTADSYQAASQASATLSPPDTSGSCPGTVEARETSKSPLLRAARSPILGPTEGRLDEVGDDDDTAFPDDGRYGSGDEDEVGDVYTDFGLIFGLAQDADCVPHDESSYEGYLDELDGIPWVGR